MLHFFLKLWSLWLTDSSVVSDFLKINLWFCLPKRKVTGHIFWNKCYILYFYHQQYWDRTDLNNRFWERSKEEYCENLFAINEYTVLCKIIMLTSTLAFLHHQHFLNSLSSNAESKIALKKLDSAAKPEMFTPYKHP